MPETQSYYSDPVLHRLRDKQLKDVYKDLLQVSNSNTGVGVTLIKISDGEATDSKLELSWLESNVASGMKIDGTALTATSAEINVMDGWDYGIGIDPVVDVKTALDGKEDAIGSQNNKIAVGADLGVTWKTATEVSTIMGLGTVSTEDTGAGSGDILRWRDKDLLAGETTTHEGDWVGWVVTPSTDGGVQTASNPQFFEHLSMSPTDTVTFGNIALEDSFLHDGLFTGSSEAGYAIPASSDTDGGLYYYHRMMGDNINEFRLVFVIQSGASAYTSVEVIEQNIEGSGGTQPS